MTTKSAKEWIQDGYKASFMEQMSEGDFYNGADKDIVDTVRAVLNY